jgi:hypothetical protein
MILLVYFNRTSETGLVIALRTIAEYRIEIMYSMTWRSCGAGILKSKMGMVAWATLVSMSGCPERMGVYAIT